MFFFCLFTSTVPVGWKHFIITKVSSSLPKTAFCDITLVLEIGHGGSMYIMEMDKCYKTQHDLLFCSLSLKKVMEKVLKCRLNLKVCCIYSHSTVVNSTKQRENILLVFKNQYPTQKRTHSYYQWMGEVSKYTSVVSLSSSSLT